MRLPRSASIKSLSGWVAQMSYHHASRIIGTIYYAGRRERLRAAVDEFGLAAEHLDFTMLENAGLDGFMELRNAATAALAVSEQLNATNMYISTTR